MRRRRRIYIVDEILFRVGETLYPIYLPSYLAT